MLLFHLRQARAVVLLEPSTRCCSTKALMLLELSSGSELFRGRQAKPRLQATETASLARAAVQRMPSRNFFEKKEWSMNVLLETSLGLEVR